MPARKAPRTRPEASPRLRYSSTFRVRDPGSLKKLLQREFGFRSWRPGQEEVIRSVLAGTDTLAIMPTGAGKSLCYQLASRCLRGTTLVISPLIALMKDQVDKLDEAGIDVDQLNSALSQRQEAEALQRIAQARSDIVFTTPERLGDPDFMATLGRLDIALFVIDEAHCISQWGHDFRPAYLEIGPTLKALGDPLVLALTATAPAPVVEDIRRQLQRPQLRIINTGIYRPNLHYRVAHSATFEEKSAGVLNVIHHTEGPGIVYAATVKSVEALYEALVRTGVKTAKYHGRLSRAEREREQDAFMSGELRVMVATNAFGMGIDKNDIRFVVHFQMPGSLEAYYQESGRAGRDGAVADCLLLYDVHDKHIQQFFKANRYPDSTEIAKAYEAVQALWKNDAGTGGASFQAIRQWLPQAAENKLRVALKLLRDAGALAVDELHCFRPAIDPQAPPDFEALAAAYERRANQDRDVLERMVSYAQSALCRWKLLLEYFDVEVAWERCGSCDNCQLPLEPAASDDPLKHMRDEARPPAAAPSRIKPGSIVAVVKYGRGEVIDATDEHVTARFADGTTRTFLQRYVRPIRTSRSRS